MYKRMMVVLLAVTFAAELAHAGPCAALNAAQKKKSAALLRATHAYACCDKTLDRCLKQRPVCKLVKRLRDAICRHLRKGWSPKRVRDALRRRARSMTPMGKPARFALAGAPRAGQASAKVTVVVYACARCPFCSKVVPRLHHLATGALKGKLKLYFRPFPIKSHPGALEGGLAMVAAARLGRFWPFIKRLYAAYDSFAVAKLVPWAAAVGLDRARFRRLMVDRATRARLVASKKEGLRNRVNATPTLFINGRKYYGEMDRATLLDVLDEEHDRVTKRKTCGPALP